MKMEFNQHMDGQRGEGGPKAVSTTHLLDLSRLPFFEKKKSEFME